MAIDTFFAYCDVSPKIEEGLAHSDEVHALHFGLGLFEAYDAAVVCRMHSGQAGRVVAAVSDMGAKIEGAMQRGAKIQSRQLKADQKAMAEEARTR